MTIDEIRAVADQMQMKIPEEYGEYYRIGQWTPWEPNTTSFTGWKTDALNPYQSAEAMSKRLEYIESPSQVGFVGQWMHVVSEDGPLFYVNLPGFQGGQYQKGECFDIGDERVYSNTPPEEIERLLKLGLKKLLLLVEVHG